MRFTYAASSNTATNGVALGETDQDVYVKKIIVGLPVTSGNIVLYNSKVAVGSASTNIAFKKTYGTVAETSERVIDFTADGCPGLQLNGGNLQIDQTMQVTVLWDTEA